MIYAFILLSSNGRRYLLGSRWWRTSFWKWHHTQRFASPTWYKKWCKQLIATSRISLLFISLSWTFFSRLLFQVYVSYVANYEIASALCAKLREKNEAFKLWEQTELKQIGGGAHSLSFLLVKHTLPSLFAIPEHYRFGYQLMFLSPPISISWRR